MRERSRDAVMGPAPRSCRRAAMTASAPQRAPGQPLEIRPGWLQPGMRLWHDISGQQRHDIS
jgi:hypothetical protein